MLDCLHRRVEVTGHNEDGVRYDLIILIPVNKFSMYFCMFVCVLVINI
jgi:hypothetical protein